MVKLVGWVIAPPLDAPTNVGGWRAFDVRSAHYHSEKKHRVPFITRWYFPSGPRWAKIQPPTVGTPLTLAGELLGRHEHKYSGELFAPLAIKVLGLDYFPIRQFGGSGAEGTSSQSSPP